MSAYNEFEEREGDYVLFGDLSGANEWWWRVEDQEGEILVECEEPVKRRKKAIRDARAAAQALDG